MEIESGEFICPECGNNGMSNYLKWQCKEKNRWIFYKKDKGWEYKANSYRDHDDNEFFTWEHTEMLMKVGKIMKEKELNFIFFLNGLVIFGDVIIANINREIFKILF